MVITALALVSALLGVLLLTGHRQRSAVVAASLLVVIAGVTVVADYLDIDGSVQTLRSTYFFIAQVGPGVYLTAVGVVIWGIGALTNLWRSLQIPSHEVSTTGYERSRERGPELDPSIDPDPHSRTRFSILEPAAGSGRCLRLSLRSP